jgi:hypothetical protein
MFNHFVVILLVIAYYGFLASILGYLYYLIAYKFIPFIIRVRRNRRKRKADAEYEKRNAKYK